MSENPHDCCGVDVSCCSEPFPTRLHITIENTSKCSCPEGGETYPLIYNPVTGHWEDDTDFDNCFASGYFRLGSDCVLDIDCSGGESASLKSKTCNPLSLVYEKLDSGGCCGQTATLKFTVTK